MNIALSIERHLWIIDVIIDITDVIVDARFVFVTRSRFYAIAESRLPISCVKSEMALSREEQKNVRGKFGP